MADFNLFDMVGLAFDPPETNAKKVKKEIDQKVAELGSALGRETQQTNRDALQAKKDYLEGVAARILSPDGKKIIDQGYIKSLAEKKIDAEMSALRSKVKLYAMAGKHIVTAKAIRDQRKETKLSAEHVKEIYQAAGFEIVEVNMLAAYPKFPANIDRTHSDLVALRGTKDPNPNGADTSVVEDLYAFAAYLENDVASIPLYRDLDREKLWSIFNTASLRFSQRNDNLGKLCGQLSAAAKTNVFDSDENREAYNLYLVYRSEELTELFATLKGCKKTELETEEFAEHCIRKIICKYFPQYEVALAIYNKEGNCEYDPPKPHYTIKCNYCGEISEFESEADAMKANACKNCRKPLFKKCDKCGKAIPVFKDSCPHCGYVFASAALFSKFFQQAEAAFRKSDFDAARQYLFQAQTAAPGEKVRIDQLAKLIEKEEAVLKEPINRLRQLIAERKFNTAKTELGSIIRKYPNLNTTEFDQTINGELTKADRLFSSVSSGSASKKADMCVTILMQCVDYPPALSFLRATAPTPCNSITVVPVSGTGVINVSWSHSTEQGVNYRLVRKKGVVAPASENDGDILAEKTSATSFIDERIKPGQIYTYSIFTMRWDVFSSPVSKTGMLYADVQNLRVSQHGTVIRITWDAPDNCRGATITRTCEGKTTVLLESAHGSYEDSNIQYGKTYAYKVFANYSDSSKSAGIENVITPLPIVDSFTINASHIKGVIYKVSWSIKQRGIDLRVVSNGKLMAEARSEDSEVQVSLPKDSYCTISVLAFSGGKWICSTNVIDINTFSACSIDKRATQMQESMISGRNGISYRIDMRIHLTGSVPQNVSSFLYAVRSSSSKNRWASISEVSSASDIQRISAEAYAECGCIRYQTQVQNETAFFITVFTCYSVSGKEIIAEPQKLKVDRPLNANLFWSVEYGLFDGLKLAIELSGNKMIEYVPEFLLCYCDASQFISSHDDKNAQVLLRIPSIDLESPVKEYKKTYQIKTDLSARSLKKCRFFLFELDEADGDTITLRWKQGFSGKV